MPRTIRLLVGLLLFSLCFGQQQITWFSIADIAGTGGNVALATTGNARLCQLVAPVGNAAVVRWGDFSISGTRGAIIAPGGGQFIPPGGTMSQGGGQYVFSLANTYVRAAVGDTVTVTCAR